MEACIQPKLDNSTKNKYELRELKSNEGSRRDSLQRDIVGTRVKVSFNAPTLGIIFIMIFYKI